MKGKHTFTLIAILAITVFMVFWVGLGFGTGEGAVQPLVKQMKLGLDIKGGVIVTYQVITDEKDDDLAVTMMQTKDVLQRRIDSMGLTEPNIYTEGDDRIVIELPGVKNAEEAISLIGSTAKLGFYTVEDNKQVMAGMPLDTSYMTEILSGEDVADASVHRSDKTTNVGNFDVGLKFTGEGAKKFGIATEEIVNKYGQSQIAIVLDNKIISAPYVNKIINQANAAIEGKFTQEEATNLALLIRGGALPAEMKQLYYNAIGPTLGLGALNSAVMAALVGFALVALYMIFFYRLPGVVATISLVLYSMVILMLMVGLNATLTLPGIAGFVLSIGMAVDANVIIFERIKEELRANKTLYASIGHGFKKATATILDANITTIIAAIVLFQFGSGPIKGFAVTLLLGIIVSMITAIFITQSILTTLAHYDAFKNEKLYGV